MGVGSLNKQEHFPEWFQSGKICTDYLEFMKDAIGHQEISRTLIGKQGVVHTHQ